MTEWERIGWPKPPLLGTPLPESRRKSGRSKYVAKLRARDGDDCCWCGRVMFFDVDGVLDEMPTIEHVVPKSKGGANAMKNLALAHHRCNNGRGNRDMVLYRNRH